MFHDELVKNGGRPWYPIHLLEEVSKNPREYNKLLQAWQEYPDAQPDDWEVFGRQHLRWHWFREWQGKRRKEFEGRISEYTGWAKRFLLNRHAFTAPFAFEFAEDPKHQDQLTTWIEYLTYEYNFYSQRYEWHKRREKWYNAQWKKLMDSGVLRPHETHEFILDVESSFQHTSERTQAEQAVKLARSAVPSAQQAIPDPRCPPLSARRRLTAAQSKLDAAIQSFESIKRRNDLVTEFCRTTQNYRDAKRNAERHIILLQWIREQVPLIELELDRSMVAKSSLDVRRGSSRGAKRGQADEARKEQGKKRQKRYEEYQPSPSTRKRNRSDISLDDGSPSKRSRYVHDSTGGSQGFGITATTKQDGHDKATLKTSMLLSTQSTDISPSPAISQQLRRSARIAARQDPSRNAVAPPRVARSSRQGSRRKITQAPPSSTGSLRRSK